MPPSYRPLVAVVVLAFLVQHTIANLTARQAMVDMGRGINLGNTFDRELQSRDQATNERIMDLWWDKGFRNVRIPVTWCSDVDTCSFDPTSLLTRQVTNLTTYALNKGYHVMLNAHHEHWLKDHYDGTPRYNDRFWGLWRGIATHFSGFSRKLMFEVLNEPEKVFGDWSPNTPHPNDPVAIELTRRINGVGYSAIRDADNTRIILLAPNGMGNQGQINSVYPDENALPGTNDPYLGVSLHTYDPWDFCGQTGSNSRFSSTQAMRNDLNSMFSTLENWYRRTNVPTNIGEYGVGRQGPQDERDSDMVREYYRYVTDRSIANGWSTSVWDDRGWFRITDDNISEFPMGLADATLGL